MMSQSYVKIEKFFLTSNMLRLNKDWFASGLNVVAGSCLGSPINMSFFGQYCNGMILLTSTHYKELVQTNETKQSLERIHLQ